MSDETIDEKRVICPTCGDQPDAKGLLPHEHYVWCHDYQAAPEAATPVTATTSPTPAKAQPATTPAQPADAATPVPPAAEPGSDKA